MMTGQAQQGAEADRQAPHAEVMTLPKVLPMGLKHAGQIQQGWAFSILWQQQY